MKKTQENNKDNDTKLYNKLFELYDKTYYSLKNFHFDSNLQNKTLFFRILRVVLAIFVIFIGIRLIVNKNTAINSLQGFINGRVVSISSPIEGKLNYFTDMTTGLFVRKNQKIAQIINYHKEFISDLEIRIQESESKLLALKEHLSSLEQLLEERQSDYENASYKSNTHKNIRVNYEKERLGEIKAELKEATSKKFIAAQEAARMTELYKDGFVSLADYENAVEKAQQNEENVKSKSFLLKQAKSQVYAASKGLQIDGALTTNYDEAQRKLLKKELLDLKQKISETELQIKLEQAEFNKLNNELIKQQNNIITSPIDGVVWTVSAKEDENINAHDPVIKVIDCSDRWVDAFISEQDFSTLYIGAPVSIKSLNADKRVWTGYIRAIRSGDSRVEVGNDLDIMPPELIRKQVVLKIEVNWDKEDSNLMMNRSEFCRVGGSVEVEFERRSSSKPKFLGLTF